MAELINFIKLVEERNLLFELECCSESKNNKFLTIENYIDWNFGKEETVLLKYKSAEILGKNIEDDSAIELLSKVLDVDLSSMKKMLIQYRETKITKLALDLRMYYLSFELAQLDNCFIYLFAKDELYKVDLGIFTELKSGKHYQYPGASFNAFHHSLERFDVVIIKENEFFFDKRFVELCFNTYPYNLPEWGLKIGVKKFLKYNNKTVFLNTKPLPLWRLKLNLKMGIGNIGCVKNFYDDQWEVFRFLAANMEKNIDIKKIIALVESKLSENLNRTAILNDVIAENKFPESLANLSVVKFSDMKDPKESILVLFILKVANNNLLLW